MLDQLLLSEKQASNAVAKALIEISALSRPLIQATCGIMSSIATFVRLDGMTRAGSACQFRIERALTMIYSPRLEMFGIRMRMFPQAEASAF